MPDCIFHQRLKQQARDQSIQRRRRKPHFDGQSVLEPDPLDVEIEVDQLYLAPQRDLLCFPPGQGLAKEFAEVGQHFVRFLYPALPHQNDDRVERIEKEMRMELHLECAEPRLRQLICELCGAQLELCRQFFTFLKLTIVVHAVLNADYRPIENHVEMKIDQQDGLKGCEKLPWEPGQAE